MSQSYNQVIERNKLLSEALFKIKGFGNGLFSDVILHNQIATFKYPLMYMEDIPVPMPPGVETFGFRVHFMSPVAQNKQKNFNIIGPNANEIKSDMRQSCKDFLAFWVQDHELDTFSIEKATTPTFFEDETADRLAGCYIDITFKQPFSYNVCAIPASDVPPPPSTTCDPATYKNSDDSFIQSIESGASFTAPDVVMTINGVPQPAIPANKNAVFVVPAAPVDTDFQGVPTGVDTPAGDNLDINVKYENGANVGTLTVNTANVKEVEVPNPLAVLNTSSLNKTGATSSKRDFDDGYLERGRGVDWFNLDFTNPFGNTKAITGTTGGSYNETLAQYEDINGDVTTEALAFPSGLMCTWKGYDQTLTGEVFTLDYNPLQTGTTASMITGATASGYARGGFAGFFVCNRTEMELFFKSSADSTSAFRWIPLSHDLTGAVLMRVLTSTPTSSVNNFGYVSNVVINQLAVSASNTVFVGRYLDVANDLGL